MRRMIGKPNCCLTSIKLNAFLTMFMLNFVTVTDNCGELNLNVSTGQFVVQNKEIIQSEKHFKPFRVHKCILKYVLNCRREVKMKQDGMLMVTVQR